ncbi:MAG: hypothetical protein OHK0021_01950 [Bryobacter sp.]
MKQARWTWWVDCLLILLLAGLAIRPMWKLKYTDNWGSIESTFIADGRMLKDNWPAPLWQPHWYGGTRWDFIYPPALRFGTASLAKFYPMDPAKAYHLYAAFFYCFGMATLYLFARVGFHRRGAGWAAALLCLIVSPAYPLFPNVFEDGFRFGTTKLNALVRYGEGPHMTAVAWLPLALMLAWMAQSRRSRTWAVAAGAACAMIVANNFYGATALAMFYPFLVWAWWLERKTWNVLLLSAIPPLVAYGLTASWLTPEYLKVTLRNMVYVSEKGNAWSAYLALAVLVVYAAGTWFWKRKANPGPWAVFLLGATALFTLNVVGNEKLGFRVIGEPQRLIPELDILYNFALVAFGYRLWAWRGWWGKGSVLAGILLLVALHQSYIRHHRAIFPARVEAKDSIHYQIPAWIAENRPYARTHITGSPRFWFNAWHTLSQMGGGSEQGLLNEYIMPAQWEATMGEETRTAIAWYQTLGVDLVVTSGPESEDVYKDFQNPRKFDGFAQKLYDDGKGNRIYEIPRRYRSLARVVDREELEALKTAPGQTDAETLARFVKLLEQGPEAPTQSRWQSFDELLVRANVAEGQSLIVQVSYDPYWQAQGDLGPIPVKADALGFLRLDAPAGTEEVRLRFTKPLSKSAGEVIFFVTLIAGGCLVWNERRKSTT